MVLKCELKARNEITAIGALDVPVLGYSFGIINWRNEGYGFGIITGELKDTVLV